MRKRGRPPKKKGVKCIRCNIVFSSVAALKAHNRGHTQKMKEMSLLEEGNVPSETKIGSGFKGKNRVIIS
ncbi:MAG: hypothetical protein HYW27_01290 [Candidatus Aenigmarchaeota archaeon]|nr:hypothetical protein [Candidatus Aenigmarchaeota archaeon]